MIATPLCMVMKKAAGHGQQLRENLCARVPCVMRSFLYVLKPLKAISMGIDPGREELKLDHSADLLFTEWVGRDTNDKMTDRIFPAELARTTGKEEPTDMYSRAAWTKMIVLDAITKAGAEPTSVRWIEAEKGVRKYPILRAQLVT